jgi:hypothetical protein
MNWQDRESISRSILVRIEARPPTAMTRIAGAAGRKSRRWDLDQIAPRIAIPAPAGKKTKREKES